MSSMRTTHTEIYGVWHRKIEEELKEYFPDLIIKRFDQEIARSKSIQTEILEAFQDKEIDILVGTQMITKVWTLNMWDW